MKTKQDEEILEFIHNRVCGNVCDEESLCFSEDDLKEALALQRGKILEAIEKRLCPRCLADKQNNCSCLICNTLKELKEQIEGEKDG